MIANVSLNQIRFLAALGNDEALKTLETANVNVVLLQLNLETIQYWQRDFQWREWKKHLHASGRFLCVKSALSVLRLAKDVFENDTQGDTQFSDALLTVENWLALQDKDNSERVRQLKKSLKMFDSKYSGERIPYGARSAISGVTEIASIIEDAKFAGWWRRSMWWTYISLTGLDFFNADELNRGQMFDAVRKSVFDYYNAAPNTSLDASAKQLPY